MALKLQGNYEEHFMAVGDSKITRDGGDNVPDDQLFSPAEPAVDPAITPPPETIASTSPTPETPVHESHYSEAPPPDTSVPKRDKPATASYTVDRALVDLREEINNEKVNTALGDFNRLDDLGQELVLKQLAKEGQLGPFLKQINDHRDEVLENPDRLTQLLAHLPKEHAVTLLKRLTGSSQFFKLTDALNQPEQKLFFGALYSEALSKGDNWDIRAGLVTLLADDPHTLMTFMGLTGNGSTDRYLMEMSIEASAKNNDSSRRALQTLFGELEHAAPRDPVLKEFRGQLTEAANKVYRRLDETQQRLAHTWFIGDAAKGMGEPLGAVIGPSGQAAKGKVEGKTYNIKHALLVQAAESQFEKENAGRLEREGITIAYLREKEDYVHSKIKEAVDKGFLTENSAVQVDSNVTARAGMEAEAEKRLGNLKNIQQAIDSDRPKLAANLVRLAGDTDFRTLSKYRALINETIKRLSGWKGSALTPVSQLGLTDEHYDILAFLRQNRSDPRPDPRQIDVGTALSRLKDRLIVVDQKLNTYYEKNVKTQPLAVSLLPLFDTMEGQKQLQLLLDGKDAAVFENYLKPRLAQVEASAQKLKKYIFEHSAQDLATSPISLGTRVGGAWDEAAAHENMADQMWESLELMGVYAVVGMIAGVGGLAVGSAIGGGAGIAAGFTIEMGANAGMTYHDLSEAQDQAEEFKAMAATLGGLEAPPIQVEGLDDQANQAAVMALLGLALSAITASVTHGAKPKLPTSPRLPRGFNPDPPPPVLRLKPNGGAEITFPEGTVVRFTPEQVEATGIHQAETASAAPPPPAPKPEGKAYSLPTSDQQLATSHKGTGRPGRGPTRTPPDPTRRVRRPQGQRPRIPTAEGHRQPVPLAAGGEGQTVMPPGQRTIQPEQPFDHFQQRRAEAMSGPGGTGDGTPPPADLGRTIVDGNIAGDENTTRIGDRTIAMSAGAGEAANINAVGKYGDMWSGDVYQYLRGKGINPHNSGESILDYWSRLQELATQVVSDTELSGPALMQVAEELDENISLISQRSLALHPSTYPHLGTTDALSATQLSQFRAFREVVTALDTGGTWRDLPPELRQISGWVPEDLARPILLGQDTQALWRNHLADLCTKLGKDSPPLHFSHPFYESLYNIFQQAEAALSEHENTLGFSAPRSPDPPAPEILTWGGLVNSWVTESPAEAAEPPHDYFAGRRRPEMSTPSGSGDNGEVPPDLRKRGYFKIGPDGQVYATNPLGRLSPPRDIEGIHGTRWSQRTYQHLMDNGRTDPLHADADDLLKTVSKLAQKSIEEPSYTFVTGLNGNELIDVAQELIDNIKILRSQVNDPSTIQRLQFIARLEQFLVFREFFETLGPDEWQNLPTSMKNINAWVPKEINGHMLDIDPHTWALHTNQLCANVYGGIPDDAYEALYTVFEQAEKATQVPKPVEHTVVAAASAEGPRNEAHPSGVVFPSNWSDITDIHNQRIVAAIVDDPQRFGFEQGVIDPRLQAILNDAVGNWTGILNPSRPTVETDVAIFVREVVPRINQLPASIRNRLPITLQDWIPGDTFARLPPDNPLTTPRLRVLDRFTKVIDNALPGLAPMSTEEAAAFAQVLGPIGQELSTARLAPATGAVPKPAAAPATAPKAQTPPLPPPKAKPPGEATLAINLHDIQDPQAQAAVRRATAAASQKARRTTQVAIGVGGAAVLGGLGTAIYLARQKQDPSLPPLPPPVPSSPAIETPGDATRLEPATLAQLKANIALLQADKKPAPPPDAGVPDVGASVRPIAEALKDMQSTAAYAELMAKRDEAMKTGQPLSLEAINEILIHQGIADKEVCLDFFKLAENFFERQAKTQADLKELGALTLVPGKIQPPAKKAAPNLTATFIFERFAFTPVGEVLFVPRDVHMLIVFKNDFDFFRAAHSGDSILTDHPGVKSFGELGKALQGNKQALTRLKSMKKSGNNTAGLSLGNGFTLAKSYTTPFDAETLHHEEGHEMDSIGPYFESNGDAWAALPDTLGDDQTEQKSITAFLDAIYNERAIRSLHTEFIQFLRDGRMYEGNPFVNWKQLYGMQENYDLVDLFKERYKDQPNILKIALQAVKEREDKFSKITDGAYRKLLAAEKRFKKGMTHSNPEVKKIAEQEKAITLSYLSVRGNQAWNVDLIKILDVINPNQAEALK